MNLYAPDLSTHAGRRPNPEMRARARPSLVVTLFAIFLSCHFESPAAIEPRLIAMSGPTNGSVELEVLTEINRMSVIEASLDLLTWRSVVTNIMRQNFTYVTVPTSAADGARFYRLRVETNINVAMAMDHLADKERRVAVNPAEAKLIYGEDDRRDVFQVSDSTRRRLAAATLGLVYAEELLDQGDGTFRLLTGAYTVDDLPPCSEERFANQPTGPYCTGFLVGEDLVATAGHCLDGDDLGRVKFVFGFQMLDEITPRRTFNQNQVYGAREIVHRMEDANGADYCVVRLDRRVTLPGVTPLAVRRTGAPAVGAQVGVIGHPSGLPMKLAFGDTTRVREIQESFFVANLDTYGGNSGSPVFNAADGVVEGILVRGEEDFVTAGSCFRSNHLPDAQGAEEVVLSREFARFVPEVTLPGLTVWVDFAYTGLEAGTEPQPYRELGRASRVVPTGGLIMIKAGTSKERLRLDRPMRLEAQGGTVRIGG